MKILFYFMLVANLYGAITESEKLFFEESCADGKVIPCYNLGVMYDNGDSVVEDDKKALQYYTTACDENYFEGCSKAAVLYEEGKGIEQNIKKAFNLYSKACGAGDAFACHNTAVYYSKMKSLAMKKISIAMYSKACDGRYALSCIYLGRMYRDSVSLTRNYELAKEKFEIACDTNNMLGCKEVRILEGLGY